MPYLSPIGPLSASDMKDVMVRAPLWQIWKRPEFMAVQDNVSQSDNLSKEIKKAGGLNGSSIEHVHKASEEEKSK
ncbi:hypothetical protein D3C85_1851800 [compost metagenome]